MAPTTDEAHEDGLIRALLVEDDQRLGDLLVRYLQSNGLIVSHVTNGARGLAEALRGSFDIVLLDVMLPGRDGIDVCREIRARSDVPVIMVTARGGEADRVLGLELGADDYITKPFSSRELLARIRAVMRRRRGQAGPSSQTVRVGGLVIDPGAMRATLDDRELHLTAYEFALLRALAERAGRVLSREQLLDLAQRGAEAAFDRSIDVHISRLRQKLGDDPREPKLLKTVRGSGYLLAAGTGE